MLRRLKALPGFGEQKAKIFLALLGKQRGVTPPGWRKAAGDYGEDGDAPVRRRRRRRRSARRGPRAQAGGEGRGEGSRRGIEGQGSRGHGAIGGLTPCTRSRRLSADARVIDPDQVCDAVAVLADGDRLPRAPRCSTCSARSTACRILLALQHAGDLCVSDLAVAVGMSDSAVSHALRLLRAHQMVTAHRQGRLVRYRLADELPPRLLEIVSAEASSATSRCTGF